MKYVVKSYALFSRLLAVLLNVVKYDTAQFHQKLLIVAFQKSNGHMPEYLCHTMLMYSAQVVSLHVKNVCILLLHLVLLDSSFSLLLYSR